MLRLDSLGLREEKDKLSCCCELEEPGCKFDDFAWDGLGGRLLEEYEDMEDGCCIPAPPFIRAVLRLFM